MGVVHSQRAMDEVGVRQRPVERRVAGAAEQDRAGVEHRQMGGLLRVERADEVGVRHAAEPRDVQPLRGVPQLVDPPLLRRRQGPEDADLAREHDLRGGRADEQRDLRVPALDR